MARINIEECWWTDPRREKLASLIGGLALADGAAIRAWRIAQEFWKNGRALVPMHIFNNLEHAAKLVESGLAEARDSYIYVMGSSQYLEWVAEEREKRSIAGKISAQRRREKHGSAQPVVEHKPNTIQHAPNTIQPSVSGSLSVSGSKKNTNTLKASSQSDSPPGIAAFIGEYISSWQKRYGKSRPDVSGKVQGQIKRFLRETQPDRAVELIRAYCEMDEPWFQTKCHDFGTFIENIGKVNIVLDTGQTGGADIYALIRPKGERDVTT